MLRTESFRIQHKEIAELMISIENNLPLLPQEAESLRRKLSELAGKLSVHLAMEDKSLYPAMVNSASEEARTTATVFMHDMGDLAATFKAYTTRWPGADAIREDTGGFVNETRKVFQALRNRVAREETVLYPLADGL
ncbi:MAG: hemerythrin domain-containing protein [Alphaproteobacteria bacterium]|nr:hemerythrin domain-containing protein [Alphaproteobacteria bacterium]